MLNQFEISSDLSTFAGWPDGELKSRVDVTRYICNYIKENELQNPENRRFIVPDKKLHTLLGSNDSGEPLRYCDIQSRLKGEESFCFVNKSPGAHLNKINYCNKNSIKHEILTYCFIIGSLLFLFFVVSADDNDDECLICDAMVGAAVAVCQEHDACRAFMSYLCVVILFISLLPRYSIKI